MVMNHSGIFCLFFCYLLYDESSSQVIAQVCLCYDSQDLSAFEELLSNNVLSPLHYGTMVSSVIFSDF